MVAKRYCSARWLRQAGVAALLSCWFLISIAQPILANVTLDERLKLLRDAYGDAIEMVEGNTLVMRDGTRLIIDKGQKRSHQQRLGAAAGQSTEL